MQNLIDQLAYRYKEPINHLLPEHYHPCDRNMFFQLRNVMHVKYDARIESFRKACEVEMLNWLKAIGYKIGKKDEFTIAKIEDEVVLIIVDYVEFKSPVHIQDLLRKTATVSQSGQSLKKCLHFKVIDNFQMTLDEILYAPSVLDDFDERVKQLDSLPPKNEKHCAGCQYIDFCNENALANVNCRTCSSIESDFTCKHGKQLCKNHSYHPDFVKLIGFDVVSADPETMTIDYGKFSNGREGSMTSEMMHKAYGLQYLQNDTVQAILDTFDGKLENVKRLSE
jgi:CRISPR/Cas system-associated exonuclease Cas4 (RecB family)